MERRTEGKPSHKLQNHILVPCSAPLPHIISSSLESPLEKPETYTNTQEIAPYGGTISLCQTRCLVLIATLVFHLPYQSFLASQAEHWAAPHIKLITAATKHPITMPPMTLRLIWVLVPDLTYSFAAEYVAAVVTC